MGGKKSNHGFNNKYKIKCMSIYWIRTLLHKKKVKQDYIWLADKNKSHAMAYQKYIEFHFNHKARWKWVQYIYTVAPNPGNTLGMKGKNGINQSREKNTTQVKQRLHGKINTNTKHVKYITDNNNLNKDNLRFDCEINVPVTPTNRIKLWNSQSIYNKYLFIFWTLNIFFVCFFGNEVL